MKVWAIQSGVCFEPTSMWLWNCFTVIHYTATMKYPSHLRHVSKLCSALKKQLLCNHLRYRIKHISKVAFSIMKFAGCHCHFSFTDSVLIFLNLLAAAHGYSCLSSVLLKHFLICFLCNLSWLLSHLNMLNRKVRPGSVLVPLLGFTKMSSIGGWFSHLYFQSWSLP